MTSLRPKSGEFDGRPFAAGSLIGVRAFEVRSTGVLEGVTVGQPFHPGENSAECVAHQLFMRGLSIGHYSRPPRPDQHDVASVGCSCGFWAYYSSRRRGFFDPSISVRALIEGYGTCTVGTRGFRASKARLVALVDPTTVPRRWYVFVIGWVLYSIAVAINVLTTLTDAARTDFAGADALGNMLLAALNLVATCWGLSRVRRLLDRKHPVRCFDFDKVRAQYPDVPVYPTVAAATAAHPLTQPPREPRRWTFRKGAQL